MYEMEQKIEQTLQDFQAHGTIAVAINLEGKIVYQNNWGYADVATERVLDVETIMGIASMSKSFVAIGIMQLVEKHILDLDTTVATYIQELQGEQQEQMTVGQLLYHAGGYPALHRTTAYEVLEDLGRIAKGERNYAMDISKDPEVATFGFSKIIQVLNAVTEFVGKPGENYLYSNDSYGLLTELIRRYGGSASFAEYIEEHIFQPLGMDKTTYSFIFPKEQTNITTLYRRADDVETKEIPGPDVAYISTNDFYDNAYTLMGGGNVKSCIQDLIKYVQMYLCADSGQYDAILTSKSLHEMMTPRIQSKPGEQYGYGLSLYEYAFGDCFGHSGSLTGVSSNMSWSLDKGIGVIVLSNTTNVPAVEIARIILENI